MGLHICIVTKDGREHPDWDYIRQGDDRDNAKLLTRDHNSWHSGKSYRDDDWLLMRPTETTLLIGDRGAEMTKLLEDPKWWVYISY